jgi:hypothetical protein
MTQRTTLEYAALFIIACLGGKAVAAALTRPLMILVSVVLAERAAKQIPPPVGRARTLGERVLVAVEEGARGRVSSRLLVARPHRPTDRAGPPNLVDGGRRLPTLCHNANLPIPNRGPHS